MKMLIYLTKGSKMTEYNGHRSWNAWNVSLWINNDESLYNYALGCISGAKAKTIRQTKTAILDRATRIFMRDFRGSKTPDGASYNCKSVKDALDGLME
jgi:hypothetical protein